jgi:IS605 OrfB family transposase
MPTQVVKLQIIKPTDCTWEILGKVLNELQYETRQILNKSVQLAWEYQGFSSDYKEKYGQYPKTKDILGYSNIHGYIYNQLTEKYKAINKGNMSQTIKRVTDKWKNDIKKILKGEISIPSYKKDTPIDIISNNIQIIQESNDYYVNLSLIGNEYKKELGLKSGQFCVLLNVGDNSKKVILDRIISGEYQIAASQIIKQGKKWFLNLSYKFESQKKELNPNTIMGIDLGVVNAAYIAFNNSFVRYKIEGGEIEEFRRRIEKRRNEILRQRKYCRDGSIGHGYYTRLKPVEKLSHKIANFRQTTNHKYSRYIVDLALKHNCGVIQMEDLSGINKNNLFLKNWTYNDLQQKIEYKAKAVGIEVKYINPQYTSQRCSKCGYINAENREDQAIFKCKNCGFETNADYNAAKNIATPNIEEIIKEELKEIKRSA